MTRYLITSPATGNELELRYNSDGLLIFMELRGTIARPGWLAVTSRISMEWEPTALDELKALGLQVATNSQEDATCTAQPLSK